MDRQFRYSHLYPNQLTVPCVGWWHLFWKPQRNLATNGSFCWAIFRKLVHNQYPWTEPYFAYDTVIQWWHIFNGSFYLVCTMFCFERILLLRTDNNSLSRLFHPLFLDLQLTFTVSPYSVASHSILATNIVFVLFIAVHLAIICRFLNIFNEVFCVLFFLRYNLEAGSVTRTTTWNVSYILPLSNAS